MVNENGAKEVELVIDAERIKTTWNIRKIDEWNQASRVADFRTMSGMMADGVVTAFGEYEVNDPETYMEMMPEAWLMITSEVSAVINALFRGSAQKRR